MTLPPHKLNPYDFIPLEHEPSRADLPSGIESYHCFSGRITFDLRALTPVCILQNPPSQTNPLELGKVFSFSSIANIRVLPASSLKGMFRSVHEIVTNSSMGVVTDTRLFTLANDKKYLPLGHVHLRDYLTPTEVMFGHAENTDRFSSQAGRVFIDDISLKDVRLSTTLIPRPAGGQPKPQHRTFYAAGGRPLGRKRYYHQDPAPIVQYADQHGIPKAKCEVIPAGIDVTGGELRFVNLSEMEVAALVYSVGLEGSNAHKIGYGKPYGFGSLQVIIRMIEIEPVTHGVPNRFLEFNNPPLGNWRARLTELQALIRSTWQDRPGGIRSYEAFQAMATWQTTQQYIYPDYKFFDDPYNKQVTLREYQERDTDYPVLPPPPEPVGQPSENRPDNVVVASTVEQTLLTGHLQTQPHYPPFVSYNNLKYWLDENSASETVYSRILSMVASGYLPEIRFRPAAEQIRQKKGKNKKRSYVLRDVEVVEGQPK